jgi:copper ion binding protein
MGALRFSVPGMTCDHCVAAVRAEIQRLPGVQSVDIDLESRAVVVTGTDVDGEAVAAAIDEAGYEAVP